MVHTCRLLWFLLTVIHIIEFRNIQLTSAQWTHICTAYQDRSDNHMKLGIFLMSYGDDLDLRDFLRNMSMS